MDGLQNGSQDQEGRKRLIGTLDPDYIAPPDAKKIKLLKAKGEEEFYGRVVKVVDKQFLEAMNLKNEEVEEIDDRILKVQQCLHTLRYCVSLNFYAFGKLKGKTKSEADQTPQVSHPAIRHHLATSLPPSAESLPVEESLSSWIPGGLDPSTKSGNPTHTGTTLSTNTSSTSLPNNSKNLLSSDKEDVKKFVPSAKVQNSSTNTQPNCKVISEGRRARFQRKMRVVIGNTYQYIPDSDGVEDHLRFKWSMYVRAPQESSDISSIVSSVKFTLDKSYSPHDVITIQEPPFSLSRRGWGEFKIYLELTFVDPRNKPIQLLHPLSLARTDDPLAFTGISRPGKETWYDIWLYTTFDESGGRFDEVKSKSNQHTDEEGSTNLQDLGLKSGSLYSDIDGNKTFVHSPVKEAAAYEQGAQSQVKGEEQLVETSSVVTCSSSPIELETPTQPWNKELPPMKMKPTTEMTEELYCNGREGEDMGLQNKENGNTEDGTCYEKKTYETVIGTKTTVEEFASAKKGSVGENIDLPKFTGKTIDAKGDQKLHKILIRQSDGSLVSWMVPRSMYNMALKFSEKSIGKSNAAQTALTAKGAMKGTTKIVPSLNGTAGRRIVVAPSNGNILSRLSAASLSPNAKKNGLLKGINISTSDIKQPLLATSGVIPVNSPTSRKSPQGTLIRVSPLLQKAAAITSQHQLIPPQATSLQQIRPALLTIPSELPLKVNDVNAVPTEGKGGRCVSKGNTNSIRLSMSALSPSNAKVIKSTLLADKKPTPLSVTLKKAIGSSAPVLAIPTSHPYVVSALDGRRASAVVQPLQQQTKMTLVNNSIRVNTGQLFRSVPSASVNSSSVKTSAVSLLPTRNQTTPPPPLIPNTSTTPPTTTASLSQPSTPPHSGKITTRRIFISAPPHLVKLREEATGGRVKGEEAPQQKDLHNKPSPRKLGVKKLMKEIEMEKSPMQILQERKENLRRMSAQCSSMDEILRIYLKGLPLASTGERDELDLPFVAPSLDHLKGYLLGKRRAVEFWRAREIRRELKVINAPDWQSWNTVKIVSWARKHLYSPCEDSEVTVFDKRCGCHGNNDSLYTLTTVRDSSMTSPLRKSKQDPPCGDAEVVVVDCSDEEEPTAGEDLLKKESECSQRLQPEVKSETGTDPPLLTLLLGQESQFLDSSLSKVRHKLEDEEVLPGVQMDASKCVLWKAMTCLMEDLLRSTYAEAVSDCVKPPEDEEETERNEQPENVSVKLEAKHLLSALRNGRPQFQLLTQFGLGKVPLGSDDKSSIPLT